MNTYENHQFYTFYLFNMKLFLSMLDKRTCDAEGFLTLIHTLKSKEN